MTHLFVATFFNNCTTHASKTMTMLHYRITAIMKVETDIVTSTAVRPIGQPVILLILYVCQDLQNWFYG